MFQAASALSMPPSMGAGAAPSTRPRGAMQLRRPSLALYGVLVAGKGSGRFAALWLRRSAHLPNPAQGMQSLNSMTDATSDPHAEQSIAGILLSQRPRIVQFLRLRGAGDAAEDLYQELWIRLSHRDGDAIADPLSYVMRAANNLMLDRYRSHRQRDLRDAAWGDLMAQSEPSAENRVIARQQLQVIHHAIAAVGERPAQIFRRFRLDGTPQKDIAAELGVSLSTVEADLRKVYAAIAATRRQFDAQ